MRHVLWMLSFTACAGQATLDATAPAPVGGTTLVSLEQQCLVDHDRCMDAGRPAADCDDRLAGCMDRVADRAAACESDLDACVARGIDPARCEAAYDACLAPLYGTGTAPSTRPGPTRDRCQALGESCLDLQLPRDFCGQTVDACRAVATSTPPTDARREARCRAEAEDCIASGADPARCRQRYRDCLAP